MSNNIKQVMNQIEIPKELSERSRMGIDQAKKEMPEVKKRINVKAVSAVAALCLSFAGIILLGILLIGIDNGDFGGSDSDMAALVVYKGKVYTETDTDIHPDDAKKLVDEKLGRTKGGIDEWSDPKAYKQELASSIGELDIYSVKGYSTDFRIMAYREIDGEIYAQFFENLDGIPIKSGEDYFGQLNMIGNVASAYYQNYDDWFYGRENYKPITDFETFNDFLVELNNTKPHFHKNGESPMYESRNNENYRELTVHLKDGSIVSLWLIKEGFISYGTFELYFEMDEIVFSKMWNLLQE